ncbi:MAG: hypothetical protein J6B05_00310 [Clostridia bacterium]|nr:hypothetical protein [Clostridia bacterium]
MPFLCALTVARRELSCGRELTVARRELPYGRELQPVVALWLYFNNSATQNVVLHFTPPRGISRRSHFTKTVGFQFTRVWTIAVVNCPADVNCNLRLR